MFRAGRAGLRMAKQPQVLIDVHTHMYYPAYMEYARKKDCCCELCDAQHARLLRLLCWSCSVGPVQAHCHALSSHDMGFAATPGRGVEVQGFANGLAMHFQVSRLNAVHAHPPSYRGMGVVNEKKIMINPTAGVVDPTAQSRSLLLIYKYARPICDAVRLPSN